MVDRRERRDLQDGKGKDRQSKCHVHHQRQGLGRDVEWETQRHMGFYDWPTEGSRQSGGSEKTGRDISLEFRLDLDLDVGGGLRLGARFGAEEIKVALNSNAAAESDLKRFETGVTCLNSSAILAVLNPCVVHLQLPLGGDDIIGAVTFVKEITEDTKFPIITGIINQGRFWEDAFQTEFIGEEPNQATARGDYGVLVKREAHPDHGKDFVFLQRKCDERFSWYVERVAGDTVLEIGSRIDFQGHAGMIVHHVFKSQ